MTTASAASAAAAGTTVCSTESNKSTKPVDRDWLVKLLAKHVTHVSPPHDSSPEIQLAYKKLQELFSKKALVVAPMVDASDLPFRLQCRRYGCNLAFTPMIHAKLFCTKPSYRKKFFNLLKGTLPEDRPLVAQFCGSNTDYVVQAAKMLEPFVDGIDLNCGCPQAIAKRGNYGAFLLEQPNVLVNLIQQLRNELDIPVSVKVRLLTSGVEDSLALYERLVYEGGACMLTIHGRNRLQKQNLTGRADWNAIRQAVQLLGSTVPILANGSISNYREAKQCLEYTGADGVMVSEALLEYPPLFLISDKRLKSRLDLAHEYLALATRHPPQVYGQGSGIKCIRAHLHRFLHHDLQVYTRVRDLIVAAKTLSELYMALQVLQECYKQDGHDSSKEELSWYHRHAKAEEKRQKQLLNEKQRQAQISMSSQDEKKQQEEEQDYSVDMVCNMFQPDE